MGLGALTLMVTYKTKLTSVNGMTPPTRSFNLEGDGNVTDIQSFTKNAPSCPAANDHDSFDMTFKVTISGMEFPLSTVQHINRGYYNGTATVDATITTP